MQVTKLAHCCFLIQTKEISVLVDPALSLFALEDYYQKYQFDKILISHAHHDHYADALNLARERNIEVCCVMSLSKYINQNDPQIKTSGFQPGGTLQWKDLKIKVFNSIHESFLPDNTQIGMACYFAFDDNNTAFAYLSDSAFNPSYYYVEKLMHKPMDYILINVGTVSTLNCADAQIVSQEIFKNAQTIPLHYEMWKDDFDINDMVKNYQKANLNIKIVANFSPIF